MTAPRVYEKANSFVEIRGGAGGVDDIKARISNLEGRLQDGNDYRTTILLRACRDLLMGTAADGAFTLKPHVAEEIRRVSDDELPRYLFYRYRYDVLPAHHEVDTFPPCLQIEPTSVCNYRCVFCYQTDSSFTDRSAGHMGTMSLDLFKRLVDQAEGSCEAVTLASRGEPMMCREFDEMLAYASRKFLAFKINTNAWFLDERHAHALLSADVGTLVFSADAASEPLYSTLRVNGRLNRVLENVERFHRIRTTQYPHARTITRVSGVRFAPSQDLDEMVQVWGGLVDQVAFVDYNPWENTYERPVNDIQEPCSDLWRRMFVWFDGSVNPCDVDYKSMLKAGDANIETLSDIWTGSRYESYRAAHLGRARTTMSPCNRCTVV